MAEAGIKDAACRKLSDKNGFFRTAAFRVSCSAEYRDLFLGCINMVTEYQK